MQSFFVTGTDTDVGKTFIACGLLQAFNHKGLKTIGYKPISAGCERVNGELENDDAKRLLAESNVPLTLPDVNPIAFEPPIAPHIAAAQVHSVIKPQEIVTGWHHLAEKSPDVLLTEGAGGWELPINQSQTLPDVLKQIPCEVILVVGMQLGCLNHALLTANAIKNSGFKLAGWVANYLSSDMPVVEENIATLKSMIDAPLLGVVPWIQCLDEAMNASQQVNQYLNIDSLLEEG